MTAFKQPEDYLVKCWHSLAQLMPRGILQGWGQNDCVTIWQTQVFILFYIGSDSGGFASKGSCCAIRYVAGILGSLYILIYREVSHSARLQKYN